MPSAKDSMRPLQLSQEEALAMLDLCLLSPGESDPVQNQAIMKLSEFVRHNIALSLEQKTESEPASTTQHTLRPS